MIVPGKRTTLKAFAAAYQQPARSRKTMWGRAKRARPPRPIVLIIPVVPGSALDVLSLRNWKTADPTRRIPIATELVETDPDASKRLASTNAGSVGAAAVVTMAAIGMATWRRPALPEATSRQTAS